VEHTPLLSLVTQASPGSHDGTSEKRQWPNCAPSGTQVYPPKIPVPLITVGTHAVPPVQKVGDVSQV
jgi:hypothetical protein